MTSQHFVGCAPRWLWLDEIFLIVGLPDGLMGLRVGSQLDMDERVSPDPHAYFEPALAMRYAGRNLHDPTLLTWDERNFFLPSSEIASARLKARRSLRTGWVPNSGTLVLDLRTSGSRRFILLGRQSPELVASILRAASLPVESTARIAAA